MRHAPGRHPLVGPPRPGSVGCTAPPEPPAAAAAVARSTARVRTPAPQLSGGCRSEACAPRHHLAPGWPLRGPFRHLFTETPPLVGGAAGTARLAPEDGRAFPASGRSRRRVFCSRRARARGVCGPERGASLLKQGAGQRAQARTGRGPVGPAGRAGGARSAGWPHTMLI